LQCEEALHVSPAAIDTLCISYISFFEFINRRSGKICTSIDQHLFIRVKLRRCSSL